jgi:hypothetical protein
MSTVAESADAVKQVSAMAHAKLPASLHGRLERATALVLDGGVWGEVVRSPRGWPRHTPSAAHRRPAAGVYAARHTPA